MSQTLSDILKDVNAFVDLDYALPTGTELTTRASFANQAVRDAADTYQLSEFNQVYEINPGTASSVALPSGFRELVDNPKQYNGGWQEFNEINPKTRFEMNSGDKYCYILGNPQAGYTLHLNGHESNLTLTIDYQAFPTGMLTLTSRCELADNSYVVSKVESYVLQSRGDDRFPYVDSVAEKKLRNLVGRDQKTPGGQYQTVPSGFRNPLG